MATRMDVAIVEVPVGSAAATAAWPVSWSAVWVGTLTSIAVALLIGLLATAFGAHDMAGRVGLENAGVGTLVALVCSAFFSFVVGGWVTSRVAGLRQADTASLHGAIVWLVAVPLIVLLVAIGAGSLFGIWYTGLAGTPPWATHVPTGPEAAALARKSAGGAATALLLALVGAVIGGWFGSSEPMDPRHHWRAARARRAAMPPTP
jgi:hypothetical protein